MEKAAIILDGTSLAAAITEDLKQKISRLKTPPGLATILVGDNPASLSYLKLKETACQETGINFHQYLSNRDCCNHLAEPELINLIKFLNRDPATHGILIQLPLPPQYDTDKIINAINPQKDVDGFQPKNKTGLIPPTIGAIIELLKATNVELTDKSTLIIGRSDIFLIGLEKYLRQELKIKHTAVSRTITADAKNYDIIIIALGQAGALKKDGVKPGAIVIDVGISRIKNKTVGDADEEISEVAGFVSPVPGGVGPLTVACLLRNVYLLAKGK